MIDLQPYNPTALQGANPNYYCIRVATLDVVTALRCHQMPISILEWNKKSRMALICKSRRTSTRINSYNEAYGSRSLFIIAATRPTDIQSASICVSTTSSNRIDIAFPFTTRLLLQAHLYLRERALTRPGPYVFWW